MAGSIDTEQARRVAHAFLDAPRLTNEAIVHAAYADLGEQARRWFDVITKSSARRRVRVVMTNCRAPYASATDLAEATELHGQHSVLWTTGELADHKATLLDPRLLRASRARRVSPNP